MGGFDIFNVIIYKKRYIRVKLFLNNLLYIDIITNPKNATRYSQSGSLSNYGGSWILISPNMMYGGFSITFQIKSGGRWDAHTENINF